MRNFNAWVMCSGDQRKQVSKHRCGRSPNRVALDLKEIHRSGLLAESPQFLVKNIVSQQFIEAYVTHERNLVRSGNESRDDSLRLDDFGNVGHNPRSTRHRPQMIEFAEMHDRRAVESDLLFSFTKGSDPQFLSRLLPTTGETDFAAMAA